MTREYGVAADARPADWVSGGLRGFAESVLSLVPAGFPAYVRIFHPAYRRGRAVGWADIAAANGRRAGPAMQLCALTGNHDGKQPGVFDEAPLSGALPSELVDPLVAVLARHTETPERCWYGVWEGFGGLPAWVGKAPSFDAPDRRYRLLSGPIGAVRRSVEPFPGWRTPNLWWPDDRAWCVATEIDLNSTYLGVSESCAADLLAAPALDVARVEPGQGIACGSDPDNPAPRM